MKTHELATGLMQLSRALKALPNMEIADLKMLNLSQGERPSSQAELGLDNIPSALNMLLALGDVPKSQWIELIKEYNFPIDAKPKDGSRDLMDRILRFLQSNNEARNRLSHSPSSGRSSTSPELQRALQILLRS